MHCFPQKTVLFYVIFLKSHICEPLNYNNGTDVDCKKFSRQVTI